MRFHSSYQRNFEGRISSAGSASPLSLSLSSGSHLLSGRETVLGANESFLSTPKLRTLAAPHCSRYRDVRISNWESVRAPYMLPCTRIVVGYAPGLDRTGQPWDREHPKSDRQCEAGSCTRLCTPSSGWPRTCAQLRKRQIQKLKRDPAGACTCPWRGRLQPWPSIHSRLLLRQLR